MGFKRCYDVSKTIFIFVEGSPDTSGFMVGEDLVLRIRNKRWIEDPEFYAHEFSEITIIKLLRRWNKRFVVKWNIQFKGFKATSIPHLISPFGVPNQRCIMPSRVKVHEDLNTRTRNKKGSG